MNNNIQLLSSSSPLSTEKRAMGPALIRGGIAAAKPLIRTATPGPFLNTAANIPATQLSAAAPSLMENLASRRDFLGGLLAPIPKLFGGVQKTYGRAQQGIAGIRAGAKATMDDLNKSPLFLQGSKNVNAGGALRAQTDLMKGISEASPAGYRIGRGLGAATIGAPIAFSPLTVPRYLGAASTNPDKVEEYAKNMAYLRVKDRLNEFASTPFLERLQTTWNPERYTSNVFAPEAYELDEAISNGNINNPGILKYLTSFNPFLGSPEEIINQKIRSQMLNMLKNRGTKQASMFRGLVNNVLKPAYNYGKKVKLNKGDVRGIQKFDPSSMNIPWWQAAAGQTAVNFGKNPYLTGLTALGGVTTPFAAYGSYQSGKQHVYDSAANNAMGMADLELMNKFKQPGFMGGLGRLGMAIAPEMGSDMLLKQIRQSMFPEVYTKGQ